MSKMPQPMIPTLSKTTTIIYTIMFDDAYRKIPENQ